MLCLLWFFLTTLFDWSKFTRYFLNQSEVKLKLTVCCSHLFLALDEILLFASSSDWLIELFASVVIGQNNYSFHEIDS